MISAPWQRAASLWPCVGSGRESNETASRAQTLAAAPASVHPQNTKLGRAAAHARRVAALTQKAAAAELARDEQARLVEAATAASAAVASQVQ